MLFPHVFLISSLLTVSLFSQLIILTFLSSVFKLIGNQFKYSSPKNQILQPFPLHYEWPWKLTQYQLSLSLRPPYLSLPSLGSKGDFVFYINIVRSLNFCKSLVLLFFLWIISISSSLITALKTLHHSLYISCFSSVLWAKSPLQE